MGIDKSALYYFVDVAKSFPLHNLLMRKKERGQFNEIYLISMSNSWVILCNSLNKYTIKALHHIPSAQLLSAFFQFQLQNYHNQITRFKILPGTLTTMSEQSCQWRLWAANTVGKGRAGSFQ